MSAIQGDCSLCGEKTSLKCSRCGLVFYCCKEHQKEDWRKHKTQCRACEVVCSAEHGYCLVASRDVKEGEVILTENPFIIGPAHFVKSPCCVGFCCGLPCRGASPVPSACFLCQWPACSENCSDLSDPAGHAAECSTLKLVRSDAECPWGILLPYRCMLLQKSNPRMWKWLLKYASYAGARQADKSKHDTSAAVLGAIGSLSFWENSNSLHLEYSTETYKKIFAVLDVYGLYFWTSDRVRDLIGLYETAGFLLLSCVPNTRTDFVNVPEPPPAEKVAKTGRVVVTALKNIRRGEILSCSYAFPLSSTLIRHMELSNRNLVCRCPRCLDPRELGTDSGTLKCTSCSGWIVPVDVGRMEPESLETMLAQFLTELHPNHELCRPLRRVVFP